MGVPQLVIFDCDGVLIDSEWIACRVDAQCLQEAGFAITEHEVRARWVGKTGLTMFAEIEAEHGRPVTPELRASIFARVLAAFDAELRAIPGVAEAIDRLGAPVCVASGSHPERLRHTLGLVGLWDRFAPNVFSATMVARGKPAPDLFLFAAERMGAAPSDCVVIEDSLPGVAAGIAAGMRVLGFAGGGHCGPEHAGRLATAGAAQVFDNMARLPDLLGAAYARLPVGGSPR